MNKTDILENLIKDGERLTTTISYVPTGGATRNFSVYKTSEKEKYQDWQSASQRFIKTYFPSDLDEIKEAGKKLSPDNHQKILGILRAIKLMPEEPEKAGKLVGTNITINNSQQIALNIFDEAVKDEITGKDYKAIKELLKEYENEPEKTKSKLTDKLKKLGSDVLTNIVTNILTNPGMYSGLM